MKRNRSDSWDARWVLELAGTELQGGSGRSRGFIGQNFTETDAMVSEEILEAYTCLDDLGEFLLQARYNPEFTPEERLRARDFAWQSFHMIGRRTIRDLIVRAQPELTPEKYRRAREEILASDRGQEAHLKDLAPSAESWPEAFSDSWPRSNFKMAFTP